MTSLREIKVLRELRSPYVVNVLDIVPHKKKFTMVRHAIIRQCAGNQTLLLASACRHHAVLLVSPADEQQ